MMLSRLYFISLDYFGQVNFASMPEVCHLFVITSTDTFLRHKSSYKAVISCQKKDVAFLLSFS